MTDKQTAIEAALDAGRLLKERLGKIQRLDYKSAFNIVTDVDKASEERILEILKKSFPQDSVLAEESGLKDQGGSNRRWLIDPLDGTTNFAHAYPCFCVSIGLEHAGKVVLGVVYNPIADELFYAESGKGAFLNDRPINVSDVDAIPKSLLATGFPPDTKDTPWNNMREFQSLTDLSHGVRRDGSAALDLCAVATGRLDGFWEYKLAPWDVAAGSLLVVEAGGKVSNLEGGPLDMASGHILASNGLIHNAILEVIAKITSQSAKV